MKNLLTLATLSLLSVAPSFAIVFPATFTNPTGTGDHINSFVFSNFNTTTNQLTMEIDFNHGSGATNFGDILFRSNSAMYAVAMSAHNGLSKGSLYQIGSAHNALGNTMMSSTGASQLGTGSMTITNLSGAHRDAIVNVNTDQAFRNFLNGNFSFSFELANCGNDSISGSVTGTATPEPGSFLMLGAGLTALGLLSRKL